MARETEKREQGTAGLISIQEGVPEQMARETSVAFDMSFRCLYLVIDII